MARKHKFRRRLQLARELLRSTAIDYILDDVNSRGESFVVYRSGDFYHVPEKYVHRASGDRMVLEHDIDAVNHSHGKMDNDNQ